MQSQILSDPKLYWTDQAILIKIYYRIDFQHFECHYYTKASLFEIVFISDFPDY